jgi:putative membrane protein
MSIMWRRLLTILGLVVIAAGLVFVGFTLGRNSLIANSFFPGRYGFNMMGLGFGVGGFLPIVLTILFWALIIGAIVWLVSSFASGRSAGNASTNTATTLDPALDILRQRYARGEITKTEYEDMRRNLGA